MLAAQLLMERHYGTLVREADREEERQYEASMDVLRRQPVD